MHEREDEKDNADVVFGRVLSVFILDGQHHLWNEMSSHCFSASPAFQAVSPALIISTSVPFTQCYQEKLFANTVSHPNPDYLLILNVI